MNDILLGYLVLTGYVLLFGVFFYTRDTDDSRRVGARMVLASPLWPIVLPLVAVLLVIKGLILFIRLCAYWVPRLWREAWS